MKTATIFTVCSLVLTGVMGVAVGRAESQTVANGPYYASPSWDLTLACTSPASCPRFVVLSNFNSEAVLDRETGLVWARSEVDVQTHREFPALTCSGTQVGGRMGWRVPRISEIQSLFDLATPATGLRLPAGHPFTFSGNTGTRPYTYWAADYLPPFQSSSAVSLVTGRVSWIGSDPADGNDPTYGLLCIRGAL